MKSVETIKQRRDYGVVTFEVFRPTLFKTVRDLPSVRCDFTFKHSEYVHVAFLDSKVDYAEELKHERVSTVKESKDGEDATVRSILFRLHSTRDEPPYRAPIGRELKIFPPKDAVSAWNVAIWKDAEGCVVLHADGQTLAKLQLADDQEIWMVTGRVTAA